MRLIRSKGEGVFFISQNPLDVPDVVLGQLGNRVQHALRAFTPRDQKAVRAAAETFRPNPKLNVEAAINELAVGEALVSFLDEKGQPGIVERALICPPKSRIGPVTPDVRQRIVAGSVLYGHYERAVDRLSAYEVLKQRADKNVPAQEPAPRMPYPTVPQQEPYPQSHYPQRQPGSVYPYPESRPKRGPGRPRDTLLEAMAKSAARSVGSSLGRQILRGVLGGILGGRR